MKKAARWTQADVTRAIKAAKAAGLDVVRVDVHAGGFSVIIKSDKEQGVLNQSPSPFDTWKAARDANKS